MQRLLTGYVVNFNHRYNRHRPLFQNRFKSIICQENVYFKELVRYIHLNPLRSGGVQGLEKLDHYKYCGHSALMGIRKCEWQDTKFVLAWFGETLPEAKKSYYEFIKEAITKEMKNQLAGKSLIRSLGLWEPVKQTGKIKNDRIKGDERILGDRDFVLRVLNPDYAIATYCGLKNLVPPLAGLLLNIFINMPSAQNRCKFAFR